ncbi:hypothetical protein [Vibrio campbellii]|uniref:hypothetical protein n=1 Tax=Vibrio campbellii TaxID=680 RepID=UPI0035923603
MDNLFRHLHVEPELAIKFIATFSRFEYALKSTNYAKGGASYVQPAWSRFATEINASFIALNDEDLKSSVAYLQENPPNVQARENGQLTFVPLEINSNNLPAQQIIEMVATVRNNLFHGGKYCPEGENDEGRNTKLIEASLTILEACYQLDPEVKSSFER